MHIAFLIVSIVSLIIYLIVRDKGPSILALVTKILASVSFIALGLVGILNKVFDLTYFAFILGLLAGLLGDILLDLKMIYPENKKPYLNLGILSFSLGHVAYLCAFMSYGINILNLLISIVIALVFGFGFLFVSKLMKMKTEGYKIQLFGYSFIIAVVTSFGVGGAIINSSLMLPALGLGLILISDLILSLIYFKDGDKNKTLVFLNHLVYYVGQILIALSLFYL